MKDMEEEFERQSCTCLCSSFCRENVFHKNIEGKILNTFYKFLLWLVLEEANIYKAIGFSILALCFSEILCAFSNNKIGFYTNLISRLSIILIVIIWIPISILFFIRDMNNASYENKQIIEQTIDHEYGIKNIGEIIEIAFKDDKRK